MTFPPLPEALSVGVYDNHTHLEHGAWNPDGAPEIMEYLEALDLASSVGVRGVVQVGTNVETSRWGAEMAAREPRMLAAVAIHPNDTPALERAGELDAAIAEIDELARRPRVRAVGETGLDYYRTDRDGRPAQMRSFEAHIEIAKKHGLALQIHDRDAHDDVIATLLRVGAPERTVFHCFSGDAEMARVCAEHGWYLSFAGTVTFKNAPALREALEITPRSRILIETDSPYLTPMPHRGMTNASYMIPVTLRFMADHLGTPDPLLAAQIASNTEDVYGSWDEDLQLPDTVLDPGDDPVQLA